MGDHTVGKPTHSFNSHAPVGARSGKVTVICNGIVSIHTPPWGRDLKPGQRSPEVQFQFTRPRGGAMQSPLRSRPCHCFNSHAPVGARLKSSKSPAVSVVSIHTPPWGRDHLRSFCTPDELFQFTRPRGGAI